MSAPVPSITLTNRLFDWLFGRDFFISYRWSDGRDYAVKLAQRLKAEGFDCFLDSDGFIKGDDWRPTGDREIRKTSRLVLLGTPDIHSSEAVARELAVFGRKKGRLIAVEFGDALSREKHPDSPVLANLDPHIIRQLEPLEALAQPPSEELIQELRRTFTVETTAARRRRVIRIVTGVLTLLFITAVVLAVVANDQRQKAVAKQIEASRNLASAQWQFAEQARDKEADSVKAAHLFRMSEQAYEEALEHHQARNAALGSALAVQSSSLLRVFPNDQTTGINVEMGETEGALLSPDRQMVLTWRGGRARLWFVSRQAAAPLRTFELEMIQGASFTHDGLHVLLWNGDEAVLHDVRGGQDAPRVFSAAKLEGYGEKTLVSGHAAISESGGRLLTWHLNNLALLWDTASSRQPLRLSHSDGLLSPRLTKSGSRVLTFVNEPDQAGRAVAKLWEATADAVKLVKTFSHSDGDGIEGAVFSPDEAQLLTWSGGQVLLRSLNEDSPPTILENESAIKEAVFAEDGGSVLAHHQDGVTLWQAGGEGTWKRRLFKHQEMSGARLMAAANSKVEGHLLTWSASTVCWWSTDGAEPLLTLTPDGSIEGVLHSADADWLMAWGNRENEDNRRLWFWRKDGGGSQPFLVIDARGYVSGASSCLNGTGVVTWGNDGLARLWQIGADMDSPLRVFTHGAAIRGCRLEAAETRLLSWGEDGIVRHWSLSSKDPAESFHVYHGQDVLGARLLPGQSALLTWDWHHAHLWSTQAPAHRLIHTLALPPEADGAAVCQDGDHLLSWDEENVRLFRLDPGGSQHLQTLETGSEAVRGAVFDEQTTQIAAWSASERQEVLTWSLDSGRSKAVRPQGAVIETRSDALNGVSFSHAGSRLLTSERCMIQLWDCESEVKEPLATIQHPEAAEGDYFLGLCGAQFSKDDSRLLVWGGRAARLWSAGGGGAVPLHSFIHEDPIMKAMLSRSESRLLTVGTGNNVCLWAVRKGSSRPLRVFTHEALDQDAGEQVLGPAGALITEDESHVITWGHDGAVRMWATGDEPHASATEALLELEVRTGTALFDGQNLRFLSFDDWLAKLHQLEALQTSSSSVPH